VATPERELVLPDHVLRIGPGVYADLDEEVYHRDPCTEPSLSATLAHRLLSATPRHA
jgi:hypothetical protein